MSISSREWLDAFAAELGVPAPSDDDLDSLLALAGTAAHSSERVAAPLSCWLVGTSGLAPEEARLAAERLATRFEHAVE